MLPYVASEGDSVTEAHHDARLFLSMFDDRVYTCIRILLTYTIRMFRKGIVNL